MTNQRIMKIYTHPIRVCWHLAQINHRSLTTTSAWRSIWYRYQLHTRFLKCLTSFWRVIQYSISNIIKASHIWWYSSIILYSIWRATHLTKKCIILLPVSRYKSSCDDIDLFDIFFILYYIISACLLYTYSHELYIYFAIKICVHVYKQNYQKTKNRIFYRSSILHTVCERNYYRWI